MKRRTFLATAAAFCACPQLPEHCLKETKTQSNPALSETNFVNFTFSPGADGKHRLTNVRFLTKQEVYERYGVRL